LANSRNAVCGLNRSWNITAGRNSEVIEKYCYFFEQIVLYKQSTSIIQMFIDLDQ
jgi:hypothetical protein